MNDSANLSKLRPHPKCLLTELDDGTGVVLNLETKFYHTLNTTAVSLWKALETGCDNEPELTHMLVAEFEIDDEAAAADVALAISEFKQEGLILSSTIAP